MTEYGSIALKLAPIALQLTPGVQSVVALDT